jgi:hypothetical protein
MVFRCDLEKFQLSKEERSQKLVYPPWFRSAIVKTLVAMVELRGLTALKSRFELLL